MRFLQICALSLALTFCVVSYADASGYTTRGKKDVDREDVAEEKAKEKTQEQQKQEPCTDDDMAMIKALEKDISAKEKEIREFGKKSEAGQVPRTRSSQKKFTKFSQEMSELQNVKNSNEMRAVYKRCDMLEALPAAFWMPEHLVPPKE